MSNACCQTSIARFFVVLVACTLCSCSSLSKPTRLTIQLEKDPKGGQRQCIRVRDLTVMTWGEMSETPMMDKQPYPGADSRFDFRLHRGKRIQLLSNGSRNLSPIGLGDEDAFQRLVEKIKTWDLYHINALAEGQGIKEAKRDVSWSPADVTCMPGTILATRQIATGEANNVGSLVFVKSASLDGTLVLLISRRPDGGGQ